MPNALNSGHQEKNYILPLFQKWQKCKPHIGDKEMAWYGLKKFALVVSNKYIG